MKNKSVSIFNQTFIIILSLHNYSKAFYLRPAALCNPNKLHRRVTSDAPGGKMPKYRHKCGGGGCNSSQDDLQPKTLHFNLNQGEESFEGETNTFLKEKGNIITNGEKNNDPILDELEVLENQMTSSLGDKDAVAKYEKEDFWELSTLSSNEINALAVILAVTIALAISLVLCFNVDFGNFVAASAPHQSGNDDSMLQDFLDWKDLVAWTAGETFSSSLLRGILYIGELSLFRSFVVGSTTLPRQQQEEKGQQRNENENQEESKGMLSSLFPTWNNEEEDEVDWVEISIDISTWLLYAFLKEDICGGKIGIQNSAVESALLGFVSAIGAQLFFDILVANSVSLFPESSVFAKEKKVRGGRNTIDSVRTYLKTGAMASMLFFVYDLVLGLLEPVGV